MKTDKRKLKIGVLIIAGVLILYSMLYVVRFGILNIATYRSTKSVTSLPNELYKTLGFNGDYPDIIDKLNYQYNKA